MVCMPPLLEVDLVRHSAAEDAINGFACLVGLSLKWWDVNSVVHFLDCFFILILLSKLHDCNITSKFRSWYTESGSLLK
jgi:hypothetical protein